MNAQTTIERPKPQREQYVQAVTRLMHGVEGKELALRCSLLLMRDNSAAHLRHCSDEAAGALQEVQRLSSLYAFQNMPVEELERLRNSLLQMTRIASDLEVFGWAMNGGTDARG